MNILIWSRTPSQHKNYDQKQPTESVTQSHWYPETKKLLEKKSEELQVSQNKLTEYIYRNTQIGAVLELNQFI